MQTLVQRIGVGENGLGRIPRRAERRERRRRVPARDDQIRLLDQSGELRPPLLVDGDREGAEARDAVAAQVAGAPSGESCVCEREGEFGALEVADW